MPFPILNFFRDNFGCPAILIRSLQSRKISRFGQKKSRLPPEERFLEPIQKNVGGMGDVSQELCLSKLKKNCIYGNQGLINNLRAESF